MTLFLVSFARRTKIKYFSSACSFELRGFFPATMKVRIQILIEHSSYLHSSKYLVEAVRPVSLVAHFQKRKYAILALMGSERMDSSEKFHRKGRGAWVLLWCLHSRQASRP